MKLPFAIGVIAVVLEQRAVRNARDLEVRDLGSVGGVAAE